MGGENNWIIVAIAASLLAFLLENGRFCFQEVDISCLIGCRAVKKIVGSFFFLFSTLKFVDL